ncbi:MAG: response regulator [Pseudolabrys sp.]
MASLPIEFEAGDAEAARVALAKGGVDICLLDGALPDDDKAGVVRSARRIKTSAPLVLLTSARGKALDNIDGVLPPPPDAAEARKSIEICIRARMPTQVLIASGSDALRGILRKILQASRFGLDIDEAADSAATLARLVRSSIGMVFLDAAMPGLNGVDTLMAIKRQNPNVRIALMASAVGKTPAGRGRLAGVIVLKKPFYQADIDAVLKRYYGLHASEAS